MLALRPCAVFCKYDLPLNKKRIDNVIVESNCLFTTSTRMYYFQFEPVTVAELCLNLQKSLLLGMALARAGALPLSSASSLQKHL